MTSRTTDYHCPRCRKYLFSEYTYTMNKAQRQKLDEQAAAQCQCLPCAEVPACPECMREGSEHARWCPVQPAVLEMKASHGGMQ